MSDIRNKDGIWVNSNMFIEDAIHFRKYGYYCSDPWGSSAWFEYWKEQRRRIIHGFEAGGAKITGDHYFYLNFCPINKSEDTSGKRTRKVLDFPDFWDGDYDYFWSRNIAKNGILDSLQLSFEEIQRINLLQEDDKIKELVRYYDTLGLYSRIKPHALEGGHNLIVGKSRRKGYSFKNAAVGVKNYFTIPNGLTIYSAYEKKYLYPKGIFTMAYNYINFINDNTAWIMPSDYVDRNDHRRASYKEYKNGVQIEKGFKSEIMALTFKDNPDVTRGKDAIDLIIEEAGAFGTPGLLKDCYGASEDTVKDGEIKTGLITIFGTSGDMEGGTADYAEMFMNPERFGLLPFEDVWEDEEKFKGGTTGFFHPAHLNLPGTYDTNGNSNLERGRTLIMNERGLRANKGATATDIAKLCQEKPLKPREAFAYSSFNIFPTFEIQKRLDIMKIKGWDKLKGQPVIIYRDSDTQKVVTEPDMKNVLQPIREYRYKGPDLGAVVIYEQPIANPPRGLYKIGYDPVRQDTGTSLSAIIVYKGFDKSSYTKNKVVAEYIGRTETPDDAHHIAELLAELYNTQIMYENEVPDVKTYFLRRKKLHLLALQPDGVIKKNIKNSTVNRVYGCHMNGPLKDAAERYTKEWLLQVDDYDEDSQPVRVLDKIDSTRLLEEIISYDRKGNFDLLSALFMCLIQLNEEYIDKDYKESVAKRNARKLIEEMNKPKDNKILTWMV